MNSLDWIDFISNADDKRIDGLSIESSSEDWAEVSFFINSTKLNSLMKKAQQMKNKTFEHKYKLGELVWIKHNNGVCSQVRIKSVEVCFEENKIKYYNIGNDSFYEDDVIWNRENAPSLCK